MQSTFFFNYLQIPFRCLSLATFRRGKTWKSSSLDNEFLELKKNIVRLQKMSIVQIWLFPLVDGCPLWLCQKIGQKNPNLKTCFQPLPFTSIFSSNSRISKSKSTLIDFPCYILYNNEILKAIFFICVPTPRKKFLYRMLIVNLV